MQVMSNTAKASTPDTNNTTKPKSWRDQLPIHPAAELFPLMSEPELRELGENIKKHGLNQPIVLFKCKLLDGRNRLDAMELVGIKFEIWREDKSRFELSSTDISLPWDGGDRDLDSDADPYAFVLSANIHRRHLTAEQKRELIAKLVKQTPNRSDRQIAKQTKTSPTTVGKIRKESEAAGDVSKLDTRTDTKGRQQPARKPAHKPASNAPPKQPPKRSNSKQPISKWSVDKFLKRASPQLNVLELALSEIAESGDLKCALECVEKIREQLDAAIYKAIDDGLEAADDDEPDQQDIQPRGVGYGPDHLLTLDEWLASGAKEADDDESDDDQ
jgi:hypothetical protein